MTDNQDTGAAEYRHREDRVEDEAVLVQIEKELSMLSAIMNSPLSELRTLLLNPAFRPFGCA